MPRKVHKELARKYFEIVWKKLDSDWLSKFYHEDVVLFGSLGTAVSAEAIKDRIDSWHAKLKKVEFEIINICENKDNTYVHWKNKQESGEEMIHGGVEVQLVGMDRFMFKNNRVIYQWSFAKFYDCENNPYEMFEL